jgi:aminopeptidase N
MKRYLFLFYFISISVFSQQTLKVDFKKLNAQLSLDTNYKKVNGKITYEFNVLTQIDTIKIDAQKMDFSLVKINKKEVNFKNSGKQLLLFEGFKKGKNILSFEYEAKPKQALYFIGERDNLQIWTQGQGKYTSHWLPSFDDVNEKVIFNLKISFDKNYEVISNGILKEKDEVNNILNWNYTMKKPMSSYLAMLAIGNFSKQLLETNSGIQLELYLDKKDTNKFEFTYQYSKQIFDFLEKEIGVKYPWDKYHQVPVRDFIYAGMENTAATIFSQDYVVDATGFNDRNYTNVNAHELAHQWFGDLVTAKSGKEHWLQEGFATYYALLAEKEIFGEDHFNWKLYEMAEQLQQATKTDTIPILNEKASTMTFYQKGAWALHVLREGVGSQNFQKAIKNYLKKYQFQNVDTNDFLAEINKVSSYDTTTFRKVWLEKPGFEVNEAIGLLRKNNFINQYFQVAEMAHIPFAEKKDKFIETLKTAVNYPIKQEIVYQLQDIPFSDKLDLLKLAMRTNDIKVRQAVIQSLNEIPAEFKLEFESLLEDKSYITQEIALNKLWLQFPEDQVKLLDKTKEWVGFNDHNLRILWLTLALKTKNYQLDKKVIFYQELLDYASPNNESLTRQNALTNLIYLDSNDENYLGYLVNALTNHRWQFNKFAKEKIRLFLKNKNHRIYFESLLAKIPENEQIQLNKLLKEI